MKKENMKKLLAVVLLLCLSAAMMVGCSRDSNGDFHCGGCMVDSFGVIACGERVWLNEKLVEQCEQDYEACRRALDDYAVEIETAAEELAKHDSLCVQFTKYYNDERFTIYSHALKEDVDESILSSEAVAALEVLDDSIRFISFSASKNENGDICCNVTFNESIPAHGVFAHRGMDSENCEYFCEPLENGWHLLVHVYE